VRTVGRSPSQGAKPPMGKTEGLALEPIDGPLGNVDQSSSQTSKPIKHGSAGSHAKTGHFAEAVTSAGRGSGGG